MYPSKNDCQLLIGFPLCNQLFAVWVLKKSFAFCGSCFVWIAYCCTSCNVGIFVSKKLSLSLFLFDSSNTNSVVVFVVPPTRFCSTPPLIFVGGRFVFVGSKSIASCTFLGMKIMLFGKQTFSFSASKLRYSCTKPSSANNTFALRIVPLLNTPSRHFCR